MSIRHPLARALGRLTFARRYLQESIDHFRLAADLAPTDADAAADLTSAAACTFVATSSGPDTVSLLVLAAARADRNDRAIALCRAVTTKGRYQLTRSGHTSGGPEPWLDDAAATGDPNDPAVAAALVVAAAVEPGG